MKKLYVKILAIALTVALLVGTILATGDLLNPGEAPVSEEPPAISDIDFNLSATDTPVKDETVYVIAGADGAVEKIIVSDWIINALGAPTISDISALENIENLKGDETYTMGGELSKVWDTNGNDLYYQGNIAKELPVKMTVSYQLDGQPISAQELAGKSGHVTIRYDYENCQFETVEIDGEQVRMNIPFAMLTGTILDGNKFRNVELSNGKFINDGDRMFVIGLAFPGLQDNLGMDPSVLEIPDYVQIDADVTDFSMSMTATIATNELFTQLDPTSVGSAAEISGSLGQLGGAVDQLLGGSSALYGGLATLLDKSNDLVSGIDALASGAKALRDGINEADTGAKALRDGVLSLQTGMKTLSDNSKTLNDGAKQVFDALLDTAYTQITAAGLSVQKLTTDNYATVLENLIKSLDKNSVYEQALKTVTDAVEANRALITEKVNEAARAEVEAKVLAVAREEVRAEVEKVALQNVTAEVIRIATGGRMTPETYQRSVASGLINRETQIAVQSAIEDALASAEVRQQVDDNIETQLKTPDVAKKVNASIEEQLATAEVQALIKENIEAQVKQIIAENMASEEVQKQLAAASEGAKQIIDLKTQLDGFSAFYAGLLTYTDGVKQASTGANDIHTGASTLAKGTTTLRNGVTELYNGILEFKKNIPTLINGIKTLTDGSMQLSNGLEQFYEEGIAKLTGIADEDLGKIVTRLKATIDISRSYTNFSGISDQMEGHVRFIYRTDEITK